ncbi:unnamed protein product [Cylicocyclus nassatus]|uniref:Uncharacterized protein n=1 Tax=Cylicocyclus nassatus TaxID=53992 RepID=A0AA36H1W2_CYLNA|nr:unnamed protein product [Cylicocyclus nassatus]
MIIRKWMQCGLSNTLDRKGFWSTCILGIDIGEHLIGMVRKSIRHYCDQDIEERLQWMGVNNLQILSGSRWLF